MKYVYFLSNKWVGSNANNLEEYIEHHNISIAELQEMLDLGVEMLDNDGEGNVILGTDSEEIAGKFNFEVAQNTPQDELDSEYDEWANDSMPWPDEDDFEDEESDDFCPRAIEDDEWFLDMADDYSDDLGDK